MVFFFDHVEFFYPPFIRFYNYALFSGHHLVKSSYKSHIFKEEQNLRELSQPLERFAPKFKRNQDFF
jgi:hypothetical protein